MNNQEGEKFFLGQSGGQTLMLCRLDNAGIQELPNNNLYILKTIRHDTLVEGEVSVLPTKESIRVNEVNVLLYDSQENGGFYALYNGGILRLGNIDELFRAEPQQRALNTAIHKALGLTQQNHTHQQTQQTGRENNTAIHASLASRKQNHIVNANRSEQQLNQQNVFRRDFRTFHVNTNPVEARKFSNYLSLDNTEGNYIQ